MKKKILVFGMTENPGGIESVIMNYYRNINRNLIQFDFLCNCTTIAYQQAIRFLGGKIFSVTARKKDPLKFRRQIKEFMKNHAKEYAAIWVNVCSLVNIDYLIYAKKYEIPRIIIHCHNSDNDGNQIKKLLHLYNKIRIEKYATDFWSCSDTASPWFFRQKIIHSDKYKVIPNAIDVDQYKRNDEIRAVMRKKYKLEDKIVVGHVGRFHFQKNHSFLIDVFEHLAKQNEKYRLILIGQGMLENDIKKLVEQKGLEQKVIFCGVQSDTSKFYQMMDCFVLPSLFEGLGIVALEAQACSLPCVLSDQVPRMVKVNDNVSFLSLKSDLSEWVDVIEYYTSSNNLLYENHMNESIFNIKRQSDYFERLFL